MQALRKQLSELKRLIPRNLFLSEEVKGNGEKMFYCQQMWNLEILWKVIGGYRNYIV